MADGSLGRGGEITVLDRGPAPGTAPAMAGQTAGWSAGRAAAGAGDEIEMLALARSLWRGKLWVLLAALIGLGFGWYRAEIAAVPLYTAQAVVAMETRDENVLDLMGVVTGLPGTLGTINTELGVMRSRGLIEKLVLELDLAADPAFNPGAAAGAAALDRAGMDRLIDRVLGRLRVANEPDSFLFTIAVTTPDPALSARIANTHARLYIEDQIEVKFRATEQATEWLTARLGTLQAELTAAEGALEAFTADHRIVRAADLEILNQRIDDARDRRADLEAEAAALGDRLAALAAAQAAGDWPAAATAAADATLDGLLSTGADAAALAARAETVRARLAVMRDRAAAQAGTLSQALAGLGADYATQSDDLAAFQQLEREVTASRTIYEYFLGRMKELTAQQGNLRADSRIISAAAVPSYPSAPVTSRILALSLIAGLVLGVAGVLGRELMRSGLRTGPDLEAATGQPVIGQIPLVPRQGQREVLSYFVDKPNAMAAEAVRNLRTSILTASLDRPPQVIMITSSVPGEGKTTTAIALAQSFTGLGKRVLLIEGDIRHRVLRDYLELKTRRGLLAVLSGELALSQAVERNYLTDADVLVGERAAMNAADLFSSPRFRALIAEARAGYDIVIVDTPPVLAVPDARVVAGQADAVVYAVDWNATPKRDVIAGLRMMTDGGARITGLALTRIDLKKLKRFGEYAGYGTYATETRYAAR